MGPIFVEPSYLECLQQRVHVKTLFGKVVVMFECCQNLPEDNISLCDILHVASLKFVAPDSGLLDIECLLVDASLLTQCDGLPKVALP